MTFGSDETPVRSDAGSPTTQSDQNLPPLLAWLDRFKARHGRPLRVLHVGNIANNGYLNAKFLRRVGVEADIVSRDYYHVMAFPEWEDLEIRHAYGDDFNPVFAAADLAGYERPGWFINGPLAVCADIIERRYGRGESASAPRPPQNQPQRHRLIESIVEQTRRHIGVRPSNALALLLLQPRSLAAKLWQRSGPLARALGRPTASPPAGAPGQDAVDLTDIAKAIIAEFDHAYPKRADRLTAEDVMFHLSNRECFARLFEPYDIIQCYATEPLNALLAGKRPYVSFEHGTLRDFTLGDDPLHRLTALGYRRSDHSFITNGDCLDYAKKIGLESYSPIIHPIDVEQHRQDFGDGIDEIRRELHADTILFCPVRHDFSVKATDVHLKALPLIKAQVKGTVKLVLVRWGGDIEDAVRLLGDSGCAGDVVWRPPMSRLTMIKHIRAADVVLDQMALPHFGGTAPQSMAAGTPVISSFEPDSIAWMFPEPPPILPAFSPQEVARAVSTALDKNWRAGYEERARRWIDTYHHPDQVITEHLKVYQRVLRHVE